MSETDKLLANNAAYVSAFDQGQLPLPPAKKVAIVACMDARFKVSPFIPVKDSVRGFVHEVESGRLREVS